MFPFPTPSNLVSCDGCCFDMAVVGADLTLRQGAAAAVVVQEQDLGAQTSVTGEQSQEEKDAMSLAEKYEAGQGLRERQMMEDAQAGTVQDKYTQIYVPVRE